MIYPTLGGGGVGKMLYFAASFCVPEFFMLSGYLISMKSDATIDYFERKIITVMGKLLAWVIIMITFRSLKNKQFCDIFEEYINGAFSRGILPVSWFLFTYSLIMIIAHPLKKLQCNNRKCFNLITLLWIVFLALGIGKNIIYHMPQVLWLHLYMGYFVLGMSLHDIFMEASWKSKLLSIIVFVLSSIAYSVEVKSNGGFPHTHYGTWYYSIWITSLFTFCLNIKSTEFRVYKANNLIARIAANTFVVYLGHLPVLLLVTAKYPIQNTLEAVFIIISLFVVLNLLAEGMRRLPILRKIV